MRAAAAIVALVAALSLAGCAGSTNDAPPPPPDTPASSAPVQAESGTKPVTVDFRDIGAHSSLIPTGLNPNGTVATPSVTNPGQASWYDQSPIPGNPGPTVILGHVNGGGKPGVFAHLDAAHEGQTVDLTRSDGQVITYTVTRTQTVPKEQFPTKEVYSDTPGPELRLITCGGDLDVAHHNYLSQIIVYAKMTGTRHN